jgi:cardiolipin synthase
VSKLPNILSLSRIAAVPILVALMLVGGAGADWAAALVFALAAATDFFDGWIARRLNVSSDFGRLVDPIADKLLVIAAIVLLVAVDRAPVIAALVIVLREVLVSGLREYLAGASSALPVTRLAKWKTAAQMTAIVLLLTGAPGLAGPGVVLFWIAAVLTCVTGYDYVRRGLAQVSARSRAGA